MDFFEIFKKKMREEDRFAFYVSGGLHVVLVLFFLIYTFSINDNMRTAFVEVQFGEFQRGTQAEYSQVTEEQVATQPDPPEVEPDDPQPDEPEQEEEQQTTTDETVKPVDAPDQEDVQDEEKVTTPDTDKVDPEKQSADEQQQDVVIPPKTQQADTRQEGAETSGDPEGTQGEVDASQGEGNEQESSSPYELEWEGDIERAPVQQPLPENVADVEATITVRFEVRPDGNIGQMVPVRKMNPELEREVLSTLRSWRFSRLPSGVPQQSQWGTITFRFVLE